MSQKNPRSCPNTTTSPKGRRTPHLQVNRNICKRFPRSWTMTSHGSALLSLLYVHSQLANLNNIYFDHINHHYVRYFENNKSPGFAVGTNSKKGMWFNLIF